jgi:sulfate transport system permease protein
MSIEPAAELPQESNHVARPVDAANPWLRRVLTGIAIAYVAFLVVAPLAALAWGAFQSGIGPALKALIAPDVLRSFWVTIEISVVVAAVHTVFGTIVAWVLVRDHFPGRDLLNGLIDMPFAISPVVVGYMLLLLFGRTSLLTPVLNALGIKVAFALPGMVLATLFVTFPFMIRELVPVLQAFGVNQEMAAATLGASGWQTFWRVTLPALRWGFIYGLTLTFARALGEFGAVLVVGGGVQGRTETLTLYIYRALEERQYVAAYSASLLLGLVSLLLVIGTDLLRQREK